MMVSSVSQVRDFPLLFIILIGCLHGTCSSKGGIGKTWLIIIMRKANAIQDMGTIAS
jgi:hypothetical protein